MARYCCEAANSWPICSLRRSTKAEAGMRRNFTLTRRARALGSPNGDALQTEEGVLQEQPALQALPGGRQAPRRPRARQAHEEGLDRHLARRDEEAAEGRARPAVRRSR